jgi:hypothetical protein
MALDLTAFVEAALRYEAEHEKNCASTTGLTAAIREALPEIERLRKDVRWSSFAAAFTEQGYTQGRDQRPVTASRLTALYGQAVAREQKRRMPRRSREVRPPGAAPEIEARPLKLAPELSTPIDASTPQTRDLEDSIRQSRLMEIEQLIGEEVR